MSHTHSLGSLFFPVSYPGSDNSLLQVWASTRTLLGHSQAEHTAVQQLRFTFSVVKVTITIFPSVIMWSTKYAIFASYRGCCKCDGQFNQYSARLLARCKVWLKKGLAPSVTVSPIRRPGGADILTLTDEPWCWALMLAHSIFVSFGVALQLFWASKKYASA